MSVGVWGYWKREYGVRGSILLYLRCEIYNMFIYWWECCFSIEGENDEVGKVRIVV